MSGNNSKTASTISTRDFSREVLQAQLRLLFDNLHISLIVTLLASTTLAVTAWGTVGDSRVLAWWLYMTTVATGRTVLAQCYTQIDTSGVNLERLRNAFLVGVAFAGVGWGGAAVILYTSANLIIQLFILLVIGGMMLGAGSLLAARIEAALVFLLPAGLIPAVRLLLQGDKMHLAMGFLAGVFTIVTVLNTIRIHRVLVLSLKLQFENSDLLQELRAANARIEATNQALELRVQERTVELIRSTEQLNAEMVQRMEMEEELLRVRKLESLGVLAGGIAHDFNNFLMVIQGHIELAKSRLKQGQAIEENLEQIASAYRRATLLSSQLLTFAKGGTPIRRLIRISDLVSDAVQLARAGSATSITMQLEDDLGFADLDPGQIGQVLHNILVNARQASLEGGVIEVFAKRCPPSPTESSAPRLRISIQDHGCGIAPDVLPLIFDPYFTTKPNGNGLGLATSHAIVNKHGGQISVLSTVGEGTVFNIDLPASRERSAPEPPVVTELQMGTARVLVMDDDASVRYLLNAVLESLGYDVQTAKDGAEAIAMIEHAKMSGQSFDVCLLDLTVSGGMGGVQTAQKIREIAPSSRLIVSSGYSDAPVMSDFASYGFDAVVTKPATPAEVSAAITEVLLRRHNPTSS